MNIKARDSLFFMMSFALIFNNIPKAVQLNFIGGAMAAQLALYPLIAGLIYTLYCEKKYGNIFVEKKIFTCFSFIYLSVMLVSIILGLIQYPFYDEILNGPVTQIQKFSMVTSVLSYLQIHINKDGLVLGWMVIRIIKGLFLSYIWTFGTGYLVFCWYRNEWEQCFNVLERAVIYSVCVILGYSLIEFFYLGHIKGAEEILEAINPYIHSINNNGTWWPPLLWGGQLRSVFSEPSYFGIYAAFTLPFLWNKVFALRNNKGKVFLAGLIVAFTFSLFLTKARTAVILLSGELFLWILLQIYTKNNKFIKKISFILLFSLISFALANLFITNVMALKTEPIRRATIVTAADKYVGDNLKSIKGKENRSNRSRYSVMDADLQIGFEHPLFGVGLGLRDAYVGEKLCEMEHKSKEMEQWIQNQKEKGILRTEIPALGEYTSRFAETGIIGLSLYFLPATILVLKASKKIMKNKQSSEKEICFLISFLGVMASGMGDTINITYSYWLLLGLGYAMCQSVKVKDE